MTEKELYSKMSRICDSRSVLKVTNGKCQGCPFNNKIDGKSVDCIMISMPLALKSLGVLK